MRLRADGRVLVELKTVWRDGTSHLLFEPIGHPWWADQDVLRGGRTLDSAAAAARTRC